MSAATQPFDTTVTSSTGDFWEETNLVTSSSLSPLYLTPHGSGSMACGKITVTIKPTAAPGTVVSGTLYLNDFVLGSSINPSTTFIPSNFGLGIIPGGDQLLAIPYEYKVSA